MPKSILIFCLSFFFITIFALDNNWFIEKARESYQESQKIQTSDIKKKNKLEESIALLSAIFYQEKSLNKERVLQLASLYYQRQDYGPALYHFRKAQILDPFDKEIVKNILQVKRIIAKDPSLQDNNFISINKLFFKLEFLNTREILYFIGLIYLLAWIFIIFYYIKKSLTKRIFLFISFLSSLVIGLVFLAGFLMKQANQNNLAIAKYSTPLYQGSGEFYTQISNAEIGEDFEVVAEYQDWRKIKTAAEQYYWIKEQDLFIY